MRLAPALLLCLAAPVAAPVRAQTLMTAEEFDAWSTGQTLDYTVEGQFCGSEMHLPGRRTLDADPEGACTKGRWFPQGDAICFAYDGNPGPHCWRFRRDGSGVVAEIVGDPDAPDAKVSLATEPLTCLGPEVGA